MEKVFFSYPEIPVEEEKHLLLHKVDLSDGEPKARIAFNSSVSSPVLVLGRRIVEILSSQDQSS